MSKLIFGCGYLGKRVGQRWLAAGDDVFVVTRSADRARQLASEGFAPLVADVVRPQSLVDLPIADTVLYSIGFDRVAGVSMHEVFVAGLRSALDALPVETGKLIYISSTGVYGQADGEWVDENSECRPEREGGRAVIAAEQVLAGHALGRRAILLRMAGLYGPGRIPHADEIRRGQPIAAVQTGYLNLIHVDDAASAVVAADAQAEPPRTYVISDGQPVGRNAYFTELARVLGAPPPSYTDPPNDSPAAIRAASNKRIDNARMSVELGVVLKYPSYREALAAIVAEESLPMSAR